jgi:diguanylate cyclase (GGDEF)-like protein
MSRAQTLVLALLTLHILLGVLCLAISRGEHKAPALRWWGWGLLTYSAGLAATLPGMLPKMIGLTVGNGLVVIAPTLFVIGVLSYTRFRLSRLTYVIPAAVTIAILAINNFGGHFISTVNVFSPAVIAIVLFLVGAAALLREGPEDARSASRALAGLMFFAVATWIARIIVIIVYLAGTTDIQRVDMVISLFAILQMVSGVGATLALMWVDVRLMQAELSRIAHTDALTGLPNRRAVLLRFQAEAASAARRNESFGLAVFDVDHFKQVNDRYGHATGDIVLKETAGALGAAKRAEDVLGRLGGEEFLVLYPAQDSRQSREAAERLRSRVAAMRIEHAGHTLQVSVSGGIAFYPEDGRDWDSLFSAADARLYEAKKSGRNRIIDSTPGLLASGSAA